MVVFIIGTGDAGERDGLRRCEKRTKITGNRIGRAGV